MRDMVFSKDKIMKKIITMTVQSRDDTELHKYDFTKSVLPENFPSIFF